MTKSPVIFHPYLFAIFSGISIVSDHVRFISINLTILGTTVITIIVIFLFISLLVRAGVEIQKAGVLVSLSCLLFFSYGHVYYFITSTFPAFQFRHRYLLLIWILLGFTIIFISSRTNKIFSVHTNFFNILGASLLIVTLGQIVVFEISTRNVWTPAREFESAVRSTSASNNYPDIYYVILDAYASSNTLREYYDFDNSEFIDYLQGQGFFVADESYSNYSVTALSLASSLNMDYLDKLSPDLGKNIKNLDYEVPKQMIENNKVMWFLKSRGYRLIFLGSGRGVTQGNRYADLEIKCGYVDETVGRIIQSTLIWPVADHFQFMANDARNQRLCMYAKLTELPGVRGPKFVFAHILAPHVPFLFDAMGNPVREYDTGEEDVKDYYVNQLIFINKKTKEMIDEILSKSEIEPIVVLQGDTGPPYGFEAGDAYNNPTDEIHQQNARILNAYYLPQNGAQGLYEGISPVNSFRLIFDYYFDFEFPLLEDQSYFVSVDVPYKLINVTDSVDYD